MDYNSQRIAINDNDNRYVRDLIGAEILGKLGQGFTTTPVSRYNNHAVESSIIKHVDFNAMVNFLTIDLKGQFILQDLLWVSSRPDYDKFDTLGNPILNETSPTIMGNYWILKVAKLNRE